jgi:glycosyltransferase involved in cell wall biosynthesis
MKFKKEVWVVSELFYPETISTGYILTEIAKSLTEKNEVNVITGPKYYEVKQQNSEYESLENIRIHRIKSKGYNKNILFTRLIGHFIVSLKMLLLMLKKIPRNSEVFIVTNPVLLFVLSSFFIQRKKWKVKLLVHDVYPENLLVGGVLNSKSSLLYLFFQHIFKKAFLKMETIIVLGRDMKVLFERKIGFEKRIEIIENWADVDNINIVENKIQNKKFLFAGNFGRVQGIEILLDVINTIKNKDFEFLFIGNGALDSYIKSYIQNNKLWHVKKFGWLPRSSQNKFLAQSTIGVISLKDGMYGLGVPSKLYNLLAAGKPIFYIGDENSEVHLVMKEYKIGWFSKANNQEMIKNTFLEIINCDENIIREYSLNSRKLAENLYSKKNILKKINRLFVS